MEHDPTYEGFECFEMRLIEAYAHDGSMGRFVYLTIHEWLILLGKLISR